MKKRVLLVAVALMFLNGISLSQNVENYRASISTESYPVQSLVDVLIQKGYSDKMIQDLFGDDYHYFPVNNNKLESVMFMIDLLISEGKYEASQKTVMIFLAFDANRLVQEDLPLTSEAIVMQ